jgi:hypothetical protein
VVLVPDVGPVDALHRNHQSLLGQDHRVVPICIKMALEAGIPVALVLLKVVLICKHLGPRRYVSVINDNH